MKNSSDISWWFARFLPDRKFLRKLGILASGTAAGQLLVLLSSPLLTRLFTPTEFGLFAVFSALVAMGCVVSCLRLEFGLPVQRDDGDAAALAVAGALATVVTGILGALLVYRFSEPLLERLNATALGGWLWLVPVAMAFWGCGSLMSYWSLRRGTYRVNGLNRTLQLGSQAGGQVAMGLLNAGMPGLVLGYLAGYVVRLGHYLLCLPRADWRLFGQVEVARIWQLIRANWQHPAFSSPSSLLQSASEMAPAVLIAALYSPAAAGWYALGHRVMNMPVKFLGEAASQAFFGEARHLAGDELRRFFLRHLLLFASLGLAANLPILLFAPPLFAIVFGADWYASGVFVQLLVPFYLARFIAIPVSHLFNILNRQNIYFYLNLISFAALVMSFYVGYHFSLAVNATILIYSLSSAAALVVVLVVSWLLLRRAGDDLTAKHAADS